MAFVIPTYFTAIDKFSPTILKMGASLEAFSSKAESAINRNERVFNKLTPALSDASKQLLSFASTAVIVAAVIAAGKAVMDYETEIANLSAVTGTSGRDLDIFKNKIKDVAGATKESSIDVVKAFTAIGNNQPQLLKDAEGLASVSKASIILARASKMELGPAAEALTTIMNQYSIGPREAAKTIDQLAAASQAGSAELIDVASSLQKFAPVATVAGIKINESLALIETGSKYFKEGKETGTKFLNIISTMAAIKVQDPKALADLKRLGVNMDVVTSKTIPFSDRLKELKKISNDIPALFHVFGKENLAMAGSILNSTEAYDKLLPKINEVGKAQEMADKNNKTFARSIEQLKNKFITWVTTSSEAEKALNLLTRAAGWVSDHLVTIMKVTGTVIGLFVAWKAALIVAKISLFGYNVVFGAYNALTKGSIFLTEGNVVAKYSDLVVTNLMTAAQWSLNAAMAANPIGLVLAALALLAAALYGIYQHYKLLEEVYQKASANAKVTAINKETEAVHKLSAAYQKNGLSKVDADKQATAERVDNLTKTSASLKSKFAEGAQKFAEDRSNPLSNIKSFFSGDDDLKNLQGIAGAYGASEGAKSELLNPKAMQTQNLAQTITNNKKEAITVDFKNVPAGVDISSSNSNSSVIPSSTSTMPK